MLMNYLDTLTYDDYMKISRQCAYCLYEHIVVIHRYTDTYDLSKYISQGIVIDLHNANIPPRTCYHVLYEYTNSNTVDSLYERFGIKEYFYPVEYKHTLNTLSEILTKCVSILYKNTDMFSFHKNNNDTTVLFTSDSPCTICYIPDINLVNNTHTTFSGFGNNRLCILTSEVHPLTFKYRQTVFICMIKRITYYEVKTSYAYGQYAYSQ